MALLLKMVKCMIKDKKMIIDIIMVIAVAIAPLIFIGFFLNDNERIKKIDISNVEEITEKVEYNIDDIYIENTQVIIWGWALYEDQNIINRKILLQNVDDKQEVYELNTAMLTRDDLNETFDGELNNRGGFWANGKIDKRIKNKKFEIVILFNENESKILHTGRIWSLE